MTDDYIEDKYNQCLTGRREVHIPGGGEAFGNKAHLFAAYARLLNWRKRNKNFCKESNLDFPYEGIITSKDITKLRITLYPPLMQ